MEEKIKHPYAIALNDLCYIPPFSGLDNPKQGRENCDFLTVMSNLSKEHCFLLMRKTPDDIVRLKVCFSNHLNSTFIFLGYFLRGFR